MNIQKNKKRFKIKQKTKVRYITSPLNFPEELISFNFCTLAVVEISLVDKTASPRTFVLLSVNL